jgi:hypothetical protein
MNSDDIITMASNSFIKAKNKGRKTKIKREKRKVNRAKQDNGPPVRYVWQVFLNSQQFRERGRCRY